MTEHSLMLQILDLLTDVVVVVKEACNSSKAVSTIKLHPAHNCFYFSSTKGIVFMCKFLSDSSQDGWGTSKIINGTFLCLILKVDLIYFVVAQQYLVILLILF